MLQATCQVCSKTIVALEISGILICIKCHAKLVPGFALDAGVSLFLYNDTLRTLVLRAKVQSNYQALNTLTKLVLSELEGFVALDSSTTLIPCPSSLWSRWKGRYDIAYAIASALALRYGCPIKTAPFRLHWQVKKRSRVQKRKLEEFRFPQIDEAKPHALLIDDVLTSGYTLAKLGAALPEFRCRYLTLAIAVKPKGQIHEAWH